VWVFVVAEGEEERFHWEWVSVGEGWRGEAALEANEKWRLDVQSLDGNCWPFCRKRILGSAILIQCPAESPRSVSMRCFVLRSSEEHRDEGLVVGGRATVDRVARERGFVDGPVDEGELE
jgi:hypothetical protein